MPFTVTHAVAALPLAWLSRWRLPFSALVIGTMVPDLAGYFPSVFDYGALHSLRGIFTNCVPLGVICYYAYQAFLKQPLFDLLPEPARSRLVRFAVRPISFSLPELTLVLLAVTCGAFTHVGWDSFTHGGTWAAQQFDGLNATAFKIRKRHVPWYEVLQVGSSLLVLPLLVGAGWWVSRQPRSEYQIERARIPQPLVWLSVGILFVAALLNLEYYRVIHPYARWVTWITAMLKQMGAVTIIVFLLYAITMNLIWWRDRVRPPYLGDR